MTLQSSEGCPGLGTDVFIPQSLQEAEEDSRSERNVSEFELPRDPEPPNLPPLLPMAPWGSEVCLHSWGRGSYPENCTPTLLALSKITCSSVKRLFCSFLSFPEESLRPHPPHLSLPASLTR